MSLSRELSNVKYLFEKADRQEELQTCYDLLSTTQVLTVPPIKGESERNFWSIIPKSLLLLPLVVQLAVVIHDFNTKYIGDMISESNTLLVLITNSIFTAVMVMLTYWCIQLNIQNDMEWRKWARKLKIIEPQE